MSISGEGKLPNYLVVGAAKSGTTSIYQYLKQHPDISLNEGLKESLFFTNLIHKRNLRGPGDTDMELRPKSLEEYQYLFRNAHTKIVGEVSPDYLYYHREVIPKILDILGDIKIIIILRNPIERAFSSYMHLVRDARETLSFEKALTAEDDRVKKNYWFIWYYKKTGLYYNQVKSYQNNFSKVKILLYDDLKQDSLTLMKDIYSFLGVDDSFKPDTSRKYNISGEPGSRTINLFLKNRSRKKQLIKQSLQAMGVLPLLKPIMGKLREANVKSFKKIDMKDDTRKNLTDYFEEDTEKLQGLIDRDLSHWLQ